MRFLYENKFKRLPSPTIDELISEGDEENLSAALNTLSPFEIAELLTSETEEEQIVIFRSLPPSKAFETFDFLPTHTQRKILSNIPKEEAATLLRALSPDDRTSFLQDLPQATIKELIKLLSPQERILTLKLLGYPYGSVGRLMTPDYLAVHLDWSIDQVLDQIRLYGHESETINVLYVVDEKGHLLDDIKLTDFLFAPKGSKVETLADKKFVSLSVYADEEEAVNAFNNFDRTSLPVIDDAGKLVGIITIDDILRLANEEATEDMQKIGGMQALDEPYLQAPFLELMKKRAGWLVVLFLGEMLTATALAYFEAEIAKAVVLALFLPLIISSGGNAGSQASTLVIRAMALGEVKIQDWWKIVRLEVLSGLVLGSALGLIGFFRVSIWHFFSEIYGAYWYLIALTIGISMVGVVLWGTLAGALLPLALKRAGVDPATSSAPFVATIVDVTGVVIYFLVAMFILKGTLL